MPGSSLLLSPLPCSRATALVILLFVICHLSLARFGHLELASLALGEAIRVAQQSGDKACVAQAMGWLHQVLAAQGHPRAGDVLRR